MKKLGIAIIGLGFIGKNVHLKNLINEKSVRVLGICDYNEEVLNQVKNTLKQEGVLSSDKDDVLYSTSYREIIKRKEIEAVVICTSSNTHQEIIKCAIDNNKHIFCEKPLDSDFQKIQQIANYLKNKPQLKLMVGFNRRFDKNFLQLKSLIKQGELGDIRMMRISSRDPEAPSLEYIKQAGGMFVDMTIHDFDMSLNLSNSKPVSVSANGFVTINKELEKLNELDTAVITILFEDGSICIIDNIMETKYGYDQRVEVLGSKKAAFVNNEQVNKLKIYAEDKISCSPLKNFFVDRYVDSYAQEIKEFSDAVINDKPILSDINQALLSMKLAEAALLSHNKNGQSILLN